MCYEEQLKHAREEEMHNVRAADTFGGACQVVRLSGKQIDLFTIESGGAGMGMVHGMWSEASFMRFSGAKCWILMALTNPCSSGWGRGAGKCLSGKALGELGKRMDMSPGCPGG